MLNARSRWFNSIVEHRIRHDGDSDLAAHVGAANGKKLKSGWEVKAEGESPIDGLVAALMATFRAAGAPEIKPWSFRA